MIDIKMFIYSIGKIVKHQMTLKSIEIFINHIRNKEQEQ